MAKEGKARVLTESEFKRLLLVVKDSSFALRNVAMIFCSFGLGLRAQPEHLMALSDF